jgi:hypothetical protein
MQTSAGSPAAICKPPANTSWLSAELETDRFAGAAQLLGIPYADVEQAALLKLSV